MDEPYLLAAVRYVELNPVRANLVVDAANWPWSSAKAHLSGHDDRLAMVNDWRAFLNSAMTEEQLCDLRNQGRTGRALGNTPFIERLENLLGRALRPQKRGRKRKFPKLPN